MPPWFVKKLGVVAVFLCNYYYLAPPLCKVLAFVLIVAYTVMYLVMSTIDDYVQHDLSDKSAVSIGLPIDCQYLYSDFYLFIYINRWNVNYPAC